MLLLLIYNVTIVWVFDRFQFYAMIVTLPAQYLFTYLVTSVYSAVRITPVGFRNPNKKVWVLVEPNYKIIPKFLFYSLHFVLITFAYFPDVISKGNKRIYIIILPIVLAYVVKYIVDDLCYVHAICSSALSIPFKEFTLKKKIENDILYATPKFLILSSSLMTLSAIFGGFTLILALNLAISYIHNRVILGKYIFN